MKNQTSKLIAALSLVALVIISTMTSCASSSRGKKRTTHLEKRKTSAVLVVKNDQTDQTNLNSTIALN